MSRLTVPVLLCLAGLVAGAWPVALAAGAAVQPADPGADDDDNDDPDEAVPDPDDAPDGGGDSDTGSGESAGGDQADDGGADADGAGTDDGADDGGQATASSSDDDGGDDSSTTATTTSGGDDDDDGDGQAAATSSTAEAANDDDDDDDDDGAADDGDSAAGSASTTTDDDDDDDDASQPARYVGVEDTRTRERLDKEEDIESDDEGFRYRRGEFVALGVDGRDIGRLSAAGFTVVERHRLTALDGEAILLRGPARKGSDDDDTLRSIDDLIGDATPAFNHLFDRTAALVRPAGKAERVPRRACPCRIGVIDTAVAGTLPDLKRTKLVQQGFNGGAPDPGLHGTIISSLIAGTQAAPGTKTEIIVGDVFSGPRRTAGSALAVVRALDWMAAQKVAVINVSLAGANNPVVADAIRRLTARGHVIVAAAGNDGPAAPPAFPAAYPGVIAVTAVDATQKVYRYANRGAYIAFAARGVEVVGLGPDGQPRAVTGTSFAAPSVAIRLASTLKGPDPAAARAAITALEREARDLGAPGRDPVFGAGLIVDQP